jgi:hypothetical protein
MGASSKSVIQLYKELSQNNRGLSSASLIISRGDNLTGSDNFLVMSV